MKPFRFQKFSVAQSDNVFRVGTDAVLLGAMCSCAGRGQVLEIGCGSGIISLMIAQRNPDARVLGIDIDEEAAALSGRNFAGSPFAKRLRAERADARRFPAKEKFDLIISNPPYFKENSSAKDRLARQQAELDFAELISAAARHLSADGLLSVILPADCAGDFVKSCDAAKLHLARKINIFGMENGVLKRNILEFAFARKDCAVQDIVIEKSPRKYSGQYLELTKDFHVFGA